MLALIASLEEITLNPRKHITTNTGTTIRYHRDNLYVAISSDASGRRQLLDQWQIVRLFNQHTHEVVA